MHPVIRPHIGGASKISIPKIESIAPLRGDDREEHKDDGTENVQEE